MNNKHILLALLLLGATLSLGFILPAILFSDGAGGIGSVSRQPTATAPALVSQPEFQMEGRATPTLPSIRNCTYAIHYWINQPESWPPEVSMGGQVYKREQAYLILISETDDISTRVMQGAYISLLNIYHGAARTRIEQVLVDTDEWLKENPPESQLSQFNQEQGLAFIRLLNDFNDGSLGPRACPDQPPAPTINQAGQEAVLIATPTPEQAASPTSTNAILPSPNPTQPPPPPAQPQPTEVVAPPPEPTSPPPTVTIEAVAPTQPPAPPAATDEPPAPTTSPDEDDRSGRGDGDDDDDDRSGRGDGDDDDDDDDDDDNDDDDDD